MKTHGLMIQRRLAQLLRITIVVAVLSMISFSAPSTPSPNQVIQAWVFDGAYQSSDTFGVALTDQGLQAHVENAFTCPGAELGTSTGFVALGPAQLGVYIMSPALPLGFGPDFDPNFFLPPPPNPFDPNLVANDCDALQHEAAVASYINDRQAEIAALDAQLSACTQDIHAMACLVLEKIEDTEVECDANPLRCPGPCPFPCDSSTFTISVDLEATVSGDDAEIGPLALPCHHCRHGLLSLPLLVSSAQKALARCESAKNSLQAELNILQTFLAGNGELPLDRDKLGSGPATAIDAAEGARDSMDAIITGFADSSAPCRHDELVASCNECTGPPEEIPPLPPSGAVRVEQSARHLGRLATTFQLNSNRTTDPNLRARYAAIASRLRTLPNARVLNVTAPSAEPLSQSFVALRRSGLPDDGRSPLAVVLTLLGSRRPCPPELNLADRQLLDQALETFKRTLAPGRLCSTCDPPR